MSMLILARRVGETMIIGDDIKVQVMKIDGDKIRIGIEAPKHIIISRAELLNQPEPEITGATGNKEFRNIFSRLFSVY